MKSVLPQRSVNASPGKGERVAGTVILLMLAAIVGAYAVQSWNYDESTFDAASPVYGGPSPRALPDPVLADWRAPTDVTQYAPESLHLKINGRADLFLEHGVVDLLFGSYLHQRHKDRAVDVYWYTMSTAASAREVYRAERPPDVMPVAFGEDGYASGGAIFFWAEAHYVQVLPTSSDEGVQEATHAIAKRLADMISGAAG